jgi:hypothetical protein
MRTKFLLFLLFPGIILLYLTGCKKDFDFDRIKPVTWKPDFAVPLVTDEITFESALRETGSVNNFIIDDAGDISILYYFHDNAFRISPNDLLKLPPVQFTDVHVFSLAENQILKSQDLSLPPVNHTLDPAQALPGVRIDKLLVREGNLTINTDNTFTNEGYLIIRFLNGTKNGIPFSYTTRPLSAGHSTEIIDLADVYFDLTSSQNKVIIQVEGLLKQSDRPAEGDMIQSSIALNVLKIGKFEGYLAQLTFTPAPASVGMSVFNNAFTQGDVYFVDPVASITLFNSIGVPARITILQLRATNSVTGLSREITNALGANAVFSIPPPSYNATVPVSKTMDYTNANTGNSMDVLFNIKPDEVHYQIRTELNPVSNNFNFFTDTSSLYANLMVRLPLYGHVDHLIVQDTFAFSLNREEDIESVNFRTNIVNGFPLTARMQLYFTDRDYHVMDSLTSGNYIAIKEAPVNPVTHLPEPGRFGVKDTSFYFDRQRVERLTGAEHVFVRAVLNSFDEGKSNVKIKASQTLKVNFAAEIKLKTELDPQK